GMFGVPSRIVRDGAAPAAVEESCGAAAASFAAGADAVTGGAVGLISMTVGFLGDGASASINCRRVHFGCVLMWPTMRLMLSETGVISRSRNCGRATLTCVKVLLTLKKCRPCVANCRLRPVASCSGKYFC